MITPKCKITPLGGEKKLSITHKAAWIVGFRLSETTYCMLKVGSRPLGIDLVKKLDPMGSVHIMRILWRLAV
jgi:hypothetical protein